MITMLVNCNVIQRLPYGINNLVAVLCLKVQSDVVVDAYLPLRVVERVHSDIARVVVMCDKLQ